MAPTKVTSLLETAELDMAQAASRLHHRVHMGDSTDLRDTDDTKSWFHISKKVKK